MQSTLGFYVFLVFLYFFFLLLESWLGKLETRKPLHPPLLLFRVIGFSFKSNQETYEKLVVFRFVWAKRKVILDEVDPEIRRNFERQGWLPFIDVEHPLPAILIREFYLNLSIHSNDSNIHYVKTWIRGEEFFITLEVVASTHLWYNSWCILTQRHLLSMTSCMFLLVLPLVGVLILELPHMSLPSLITCSL